MYNLAEDCTQTTHFKTHTAPRKKNTEIHTESFIFIKTGRFVANHLIDEDPK